MPEERERVAVTAAAVWPADVESEEGVVVNWFVAEGSAVDAGEPLCEVQVEKVSFDVPAPAAGELVEIVRGEDDECGREDVLARIAPS